jgi:hypothetical protein
MSRINPEAAEAVTYMTQQAYCDDGAQGIDDESVDQKIQWRASTGVA